MTTLLSNRQYAMLLSFAEEAVDFAMTLEEAARFDQRPFRSMLMRRYITYRAGRGFSITKEGAQVWRGFLATDIGRKDPHGALTSYFDPTMYALKKPPTRAAGIAAERAAVAGMTAGAM